MNPHNINRRTFLAGVAATAAAASLLTTNAFAADAQPDAKPEEKLSEEGFTPIFDGKTLTGWHTNAQKISHGTGGKWQVEDGAITGGQNPPGNGGMLMTDQSYADFELLLELNPDWGIDSGVFLHTNEKGVCFQCYVDYHDHGNVGWLSTETTNGQKRMIIRPFNFFGKLDETANSSASPPNPMNAPSPGNPITFSTAPPPSSSSPPGRSANGTPSASAASANTPTSPPGSTT